MIRNDVQTTRPTIELRFRSTLRALRFTHVMTLIILVQGLVSSLIMVMDTCVKNIAFITFSMDGSHGVMCSDHRARVHAVRLSVRPAAHESVAARIRAASLPCACW